MNDDVKVPSIMPVLSAGAHAGPEDGACVMEMVSYLAGEAWSDTPACTYRPLARAAQVVNDRLRDEDRHLLVPLIGRLFGTTAPVSDTAFARFAAMSVLPLARAVEHLHPSAKASNDVVERYWRGEASIDDVQAARKFAADAAAAAYVAAYVAAYDAAAAAAYDAAADAAAAAYDAAADDADAAYVAAAAAAAAYVAACNAAERLVGWLSGLIDEYDRLSGRTSHREVTSDDLRVLAEAVAR